MSTQRAIGQGATRTLRFCHGIAVEAGTRDARTIHRGRLYTMYGSRRSLRYPANSNAPGKQTQDTRSKATVWAIRFGVAVLLASVHASEQRASAVLMSAIAHHCCSVRARSGSEKPRRSSTCPNVRTTVFAYCFSKYS